jgi:hypothetical protein
MPTYGFVRLYAAIVAFTFVNSLCWAADAPEVREDCLGFNLDSASVEFIQGSWKIVDGSNWMFDFGSQEQQARRALDIIHYYRMGRHVFRGSSSRSNCVPAVVRPSAGGQHARRAMRVFRSTWDFVTADWLADRRKYRDLTRL